MEIISITTFLSYYASIRARTVRLLEVVPRDKMDFTYKMGKFTIADEIRHIATIERYMFAEVAVGRKSCYQGCGCELADSYEEVMNLFYQLHNESLEIFSQLTDEQLTQKCVSPSGAMMPVWKWLRAMVEHEIHHRAQIYLYLNLLDIKTPPIFGLSAEEVEEKSR